MLQKVFYIYILASTYGPGSYGFGPYAPGPYDPGPLIILKNILSQNVAGPYLKCTLLQEHISVHSNNAPGAYMT